MPNEKCLVLQRSVPVIPAVVNNPCIRLNSLAQAVRPECGACLTVPRLIAIKCPTRLTLSITLLFTGALRLRLSKVVLLAGVLTMAPRFSVPQISLINVRSIKSDPFEFEMFAIAANIFKGNVVLSFRKPPCLTPVSPS